MCLLGITFAPMYIRKIIKRNKNSDKAYVYYRLVHSYRIGEKTRQQSILNLGSLEDIDPNKHKALADRIEELITGTRSLFTPEKNSKLEILAKKYANEIKAKKIFPSSNVATKFGEATEDKKESQNILVDLCSIDKEDDREIGGPWLCKQAFDTLHFENIFEQIGLNEKQINQALSLLTAKMIHPSSELESERWMNENSGLSELYGSTGVPSRYQMYKVTELLYKNKAKIETQLYDNSTNLFSGRSKLIIYDLTNMYFEGRMLGSKKAQRGRSKEKRSDCKLIGLAIAIDERGLVRYNKIYKGNISEPGTLKEILDDMKPVMELGVEKPIVVMDAGIATEDNLEMLSSAPYQYDYVCVSRAEIKEYEDVSKQETLIKSQQGDYPIHTKKVTCTKRNETMLYVRSEQKALKEESMDTSKTERLEQALQYLKDGLNRPRRLKKIDRVHEKIGRLRQQYSSVAKLYEIDYKEDKENNVIVDLNWNRVEEKKKQNGVYFLRFSQLHLKEQQIWDIYNLTRSAESTFRCLKTDLNIRPIFHQLDKWIEPHIWLGIMAYQVVQTIRLKLIEKGIHYSWGTIVEKMKSQQTSLITMNAIDNQRVYARVCSAPQKTVQEIYDALNFKHRPYTRKTNVVTQL